MAARRVEVHLYHHPGLAIIELRGEIDGLAEETLTAAYQGASQQSTPAILLDFSGVDYINSPGIALIVGLLARARGGGRRLLACGLSEHYIEIFALTRLVDFMTVVANQSAALDWLSAPQGGNE